mmetsp:Transcript_8542/g.25917  ORF Transcript_8542/g.25917 Transcript_8542/m.25917 type:complete len:206 (+) Transcript_8542:757-1374(+)
MLTAPRLDSAVMTCVSSWCTVGTSCACSCVRKTMAIDMARLWVKKRTERPQQVANITSSFSIVCTREVRSTLRCMTMAVSCITISGHRKSNTAPRSVPAGGEMQPEIVADMRIVKLRRSHKRGTQSSTAWTHTPEALTSVGFPCAQLSTSARMVSMASAPQKKKRATTSGTSILSKRCQAVSRSEIGRSGKEAMTMAVRMTYQKM